MAENKYKKTETKTRLSATDAVKTASKDHRARKNMGSAEFFRKQNHERNMARGPQELVTEIIHHADGTSTVKHYRVRN